jgi:hypothetical protein
MKRAAANISPTVAVLALVAACGGSTGTVVQSEAGAVDATSGSSGASSSGTSGSSSSGSSSASGGSSASSGGSGAGSSGSGSSGGGSGSTSGSSGGGSNGSGSGSGSDAGGFACGPYSCDIATEFCFESGGGAALPDAGSNFTYACNPIPLQCQPDPTCPCVVAADAGTHGCPCSIQPRGAILAACLYP